MTIRVVLEFKITRAAVARVAPFPELPLASFTDIDTTERQASQPESPITPRRKKRRSDQFLDTNFEIAWPST